MCLHLRDYAEQRQAGVPAAELRAILQANGMVHNSLEFLTGWDDDQGAHAVLEPVAWAAADCGAMASRDSARLKHAAIAFIV